MSQKKRSLTITQTLCLEFIAVTGAVATLFEALWSGDLRDLKSLVSDLQDAPETISLTGEYRTNYDSLKEPGESIARSPQRALSIAFIQRQRSTISHTTGCLSTEPSATRLNRRSRSIPKPVAHWPAAFSFSGSASELADSRPVTAAQIGRYQWDFFCRQSQPVYSSVRFYFC